MDSQKTIDQLISETGEYTEQGWERERKQAIGIRLSYLDKPFGSQLSCPICKTVGFYAPQQSPPEGEPDRKYRACKFCGFWQEAWSVSTKYNDGRGYRCIFICCPIGGCGHDYDWVHPDKIDFRNCKVALCKTKLERTDWAFDNPNHSFHKYKNDFAIALKNSQNI